MTTISNTAPVALNAWQKVIARHYGGGDYAYFAEKGEISAADLNGCGDTLFRFLIIELSEREDCDTLDEGIRRCENARQQLDDAISVLEAQREGGG